MNVSKRITASVLAVTLLAGCEAWQGQSRTVKGGVYGAGAGAATGAAIGGILGGGKGAGKGAAIGAVVGAVGGSLIGNYMDRQARQMQEVLDRQDRIERRGEEIYMSLASDILFTTGSAALQPGADDKLQDIAGVMQQYPRTIIDIVGHTDSVGSESMNQVLSERRAASVRDALVRYGVSPQRIMTRGAGELRPLADNSTPEGRARNRRVDITIRPDSSFSEQGGQAAPVEPH
ncbi:MAG TPA: OmpA family protein [Candidatus Limnocylindria bacterium]|nr:OmpA family protein [Candidatus Limnocylindria bacterium]